MTEDLPVDDGAEDPGERRTRSALVYPLLAVVVSAAFLLLWRSCDSFGDRTGTSGLPRGTVGTLTGDAIDPGTVFEVGYTYLRDWRDGPGGRTAVLRLTRIRRLTGDGVEPVHRGEHVVAYVDGAIGRVKRGTRGRGRLTVEREADVFVLRLTP